MPVLAFDLHHPEALVQELTETQERLARAQEVPPSVRELVIEVAEAVERTSDEEVAGVDPYLVIALQRAVLAARNALDAGVDERARVRIALEQMRHVFRDIAEGQAVADERPGKEIARWLADITGVGQHDLAQLVGIGDRTWQRWVSTTDATEPTSDDVRRLKLIARIVNQLRHTLTGSGSLAWMSRPRTDLDGRAPKDLLDDPDATGRLTALAAGTRSSGAT